MPSQRCTQTTNSCGDMVRPKTELDVALIDEPAKGAEIVFIRALGNRKRRAKPHRPSLEAFFLALQPKSFPVQGERTEGYAQQ